MQIEECHKTSDAKNKLVALHGYVKRRIRGVPCSARVKVKWQTKENPTADRGCAGEVQSRTTFVRNENGGQTSLAWW